MMLKRAEDVDSTLVSIDEAARRMSLSERFGFVAIGSAAATSGRSKRGVERLTQSGVAEWFEQARDRAPLEQA